jgi:hypothetical protein
MPLLNYLQQALHCCGIQHHQVEQEAELPQRLLLQLLAVTIITFLKH